MSIPWTNVETYLKGTQLNLRQLHMLLYGATPGEEVAVDAAVAVALAGLLEQTGMSSGSVLLCVKGVLPICEMVTNNPDELQLVNVMDGRYVSWRGCMTLLDLETGETVTSYQPTVSTTIVLNRIHQALT